ncbi:MAG: VWA domain-containing protein [Nanoarchaeota archaeon]|nr:VWA domain-containing protein [Nanoarchaeota archaeon]
MEIVFNHPIYLWFLLALPLLIITHFLSLKSTKKKALKFANFDAIARVTGNQILSYNAGLLFVRMFIFLLVIFSVAGVTLWYSGMGSNFDFVLAIDTSSSMLVDDFTPNRIEVAKSSAKEFLSEISSDNKVGVVTFAGTTFIDKELTNDFDEVRYVIDNIGVKKTGGTDLGEAIVTSVNLLLNSDKGKSIILLTDGQSNIGLPTVDAVEYANLKHVTIYTIGIGTEEGGSYIGEAILKLDEEGLRSIATSTEGNYYKAEDKESLDYAYKEIAHLTETKIKKNLSITFLIIAFILLLMEWLLINTKYRTIP